MLTHFLQKKLASARYEILEDNTYYGRIPSVRGVWANAKTLEACRAELSEVLEDWLLVQIRAGNTVAGMPLPRVPKKAAVYGKRVTT